MTALVSHRDLIIKWLARITCALLPLALLAGCSEEDGGQRVANLAPHIQVTGAPKSDVRTHFQVELFWAAWDDDGTILRYEYAVDPPPEFTPEEIASPETSPELSLLVIKGPRSNTDTLRVSKEVDGRTLSFNYVQTRIAERLFELPTPAADSLIFAGTPRPRPSFSGVHTIYVRALDNLGAYSVPDKASFINWTATPTSWIVKPNIRVTEVVFAGGRMHISWGGMDPDPPTGASGPVGFLYKLIPLGKVPGNYNVFRSMNVDALLHRDSSEYPWVYQRADSTSGDFFLVSGEQYVFAVLAVDALGAVEPFSETLRDNMPGNVMKIVSGAKAGTPVLTMTEPSLGTFIFTGNDPRAIEVEVAVDTPVRFSWSATAESYGGVIEGYSWGLDVPDLEREGPNSRWQPWSKLVSTGVPMSFSTPGIHVLYVRVRDEFGSMTTGAVIIKAFDLPLSREVLLIDDYLETRFPLDRQADEFWDKMFLESNRFTPQDLDPTEYKFDVGGLGDGAYLGHAIPKLSELGKYKLLVWNVHGNGICAQTGLLHASAVTPILVPYLEAGGKLWVVGPMSSAAFRVGFCGTPGTFTPPPDLVAADVNYPLSQAPGDFAWDFMKIMSSQIINDVNTHWHHSMVGVEPWDKANPVFPRMDAEPTKFHAAYWAVNAITASDAIYTPGIPDSSFTGIIDSLYTYVAAGPVRKPGVKSPFTGKVTATRWHDPDPARKQGRVMWWGFPLYYMKNAQAQEAFNGVIDWFREETVVR